VETSNEESNRASEKTNDLKTLFPASSGAVAVEASLSFIFLFAASGRRRTRLFASGGGGCGRRGRFRAGFGARRRSGSGARPRSGPTVRPGARLRSSSAFIFRQFNFPSVEFLAVERIQGFLHSFPSTKLDHALVLLLLVGVGVVYFAGFSHEVFEILPRDASGKVFHDQSVVGPSVRCSSSSSSAVSPSISAISAISSATTETAASSVAESASVVEASPVAATAATSSGVLDGDSVAAQRFPVAFVDGVLGVSFVVKHYETVSLLEDNVVKTTVTFEEFLEVLLAKTRVLQTANEDSGSGHL